MKVVTYAVLLLVGLSTRYSPATGADTPSPYLTLYEQRVNLAKAETRREEAESTFQAARLARARVLVTQQAMAREEAERIQADYTKSVAAVEVAKAYVAETEAMLMVVRSLVHNGEAVPLCRL